MLIAAAKVTAEKNVAVETDPSYAAMAAAFEMSRRPRRRVTR